MSCAKLYDSWLINSLMHTKIRQNLNLYLVVCGWEFLEIIRADACLNALTWDSNSLTQINSAKQRILQCKKNCIGILDGGTSVGRIRT